MQDKRNCSSLYSKKLQATCARNNRAYDAKTVLSRLNAPASFTLCSSQIEESTVYESVMPELDHQTCVQVDNNNYRSALLPSHSHLFRNLRLRKLNKDSYVFDKTNRRILLKAATIGKPNSTVNYDPDFALDVFAWKKKIPMFAGKVKASRL